MAAVAAPAVARLSAAGEAALKAEFGKSYDGVRLRTALQAQIVEHFARLGRGLTDVNARDDFFVVGVGESMQNVNAFKDLFVRAKGGTHGDDVVERHF